MPVAFGVGRGRPNGALWGEGCSRRRGLGGACAGAGPAGLAGVWWLVFCGGVVFGWVLFGFVVFGFGFVFGAVGDGDFGFLGDGGAVLGGEGVGYGEAGFAEVAVGGEGGVFGLGEGEFEGGEGCVGDGFEGGAGDAFADEGAADEFDVDAVALEEHCE